MGYTPMHVYILLYKGNILIDRVMNPNNHRLSTFRIQTGDLSVTGRIKYTFLQVRETPVHIRHEPFLWSCATNRKFTFDTIRPKRIEVGPKELIVS